MKRFLNISAVILGAVLCLLSLSSTAEAVTSCTLTWDASQATDLVGYKVYRSTVSQNYGAAIATLGKVPSFDCQRTGDGKTDFFVVTAVDLSGNESSHSNEVSKAFPLETPPAPTGSVTYSRTIIPATVSIGGPDVPVSLTITNGTNVPVTFTYTGTLTYIYNSMPVSPFTIPAGGSQLFTVSIKTANLGTTPTTVTGSELLTPSVGLAQPITYAIHVADTTAPPPVSGLKVVAADAQHVVVAWVEPTDCASVSNVRSGKAPNKVITITCEK